MILRGGGSFFLGFLGFLGSGGYVLKEWMNELMDGFFLGLVYEKELWFWSC